MPKVLIIEDDKTRLPALTSYAERVLSGGVEVTHSETYVTDWTPYAMVMLDHDLGLGGDVSRHVKGQEVPANIFIVIHSMNPVGARAIRDEIGGYVAPFSAILDAHKRFSV